MRRRETPPGRWALDPELFPPVPEEEGIVMDITVKRVPRLAGLETELRALLREAEAAHDMALEDWWRRVGPDKPDLSGGAPPGLSQLVKLDDGRWVEEVVEWHRRPPGPPKVARGGVPTAGLHAVYALVREWWIDNVPGARGFTPKFAGVKVGEREVVSKRGKRRVEPIFDCKDKREWNDPARLLWCIVKELDPTDYAPEELDVCYTPEVLVFQYKSLQRRKARAKEKNKRRAERERAKKRAEMDKPE